MGGRRSSPSAVEQLEKPPTVEQRGGDRAEYDDIINRYALAHVPFEPPAVHRHPVLGVEIHQLQAAAFEELEMRVDLGHVRSAQDDVAVSRPSDQDSRGIGVAVALLERFHMG